MPSSKAIFLSLVRLGVGHSTDVLLDNANWQEIEYYAVQHGLLSVLVDGIEKCPRDKGLPNNYCCSGLE